MRLCPLPLLWCSAVLTTLLGLVCRTTFPALAAGAGATSLVLFLAGVAAVFLRWGVELPGEPEPPVWRSVPTVEGVPTPRVVILTLDEAAERVRLEARHSGYAGESVRAYVEMPMAGSYLEEALQVLRGALGEAEEEARRRDLAFAAAQPGSLS